MLWQPDIVYNNHIMVMNAKIRPFRTKIRRQLAEKMIEKGKRLCAVFVDLEKLMIRYAGRSCGKLCGGMVCPVDY